MGVSEGLDPTEILEEASFPHISPNFWTTLAVLAISSLAFQMHHSSVYSHQLWSSYMCLGESLTSSCYLYSPLPPLPPGNAQTQGLVLMHG